MVWGDAYERDGRVKTIEIPEEKYICCETIKNLIKDPTNSILHYRLEAKTFFLVGREDFYSYEFCPWCGAKK